LAQAKLRLGAQGWNWKMPELPEVETVRRGLAPVMEGAVIVKAVAYRPDLRFPLPSAFVRKLKGRTIVSLSRRAKYLLAELDDGNVLVAHLGMSGSFRIEPEEAPPVIPGVFHQQRSNTRAHDHVVLHLEREGHRCSVVYNDPRRFGFMDIVAAGDLAAYRHFRDLGIEPLGNQFGGSVLAELFSGKKAPVKAALLDQRLIAGLGNIYVCEALWQSRLSPLVPAGEAVERRGVPALLATAIRDVLARAIEAGGSTLRDHRQADGELGYFQHSFEVYGREGEPCHRSRCRGIVHRLVQAGRSTFHCPLCQR
jgi:formamidopyrimidine-DNA glycosylase